MTIVNQNIDVLCREGAFEGCAPKRLTARLSTIVTTNNRLVPEQASAVIEGQALSQAAGWISVNQAAGQENVQSNTLSVALGIRGSSLNSESLSQVLTRTQEPTEESEDATSSRRVAIDETALISKFGTQLR